VQATTRTNIEEVCFTEAMTEGRRSERSGLDTADAADGRSDASMAIAMVMATAMTSIAVETVNKDAPEPMERLTEGNQRRRSEVLVAAWALGDRRSGIQPVATQEARELA